jgi:hypothetical protein
MSKQATNFKQICKGGSVSTIHALLHHQSQSILDELMQEFKTDSYEELAVKLSLGKI